VLCTTNFKFKRTPTIEKNSSYLEGRPLEIVRLWVALIPDLPAHDAGDSVQRLLAADLVVLHPGWDIPTRVLVSRADPILDRLGQPLGE
jgi:hypothetical protein